MKKLYKMVNGVKVELTADEIIQREIDKKRHEEKMAEIEKNKYKELRVKEYGDIGEQLDLIYHGGLDAWKAHIATVKAKYPKPE